MILRMIAPHHL